MSEYATVPAAAASQSADLRKSGCPLPANDEPSTKDLLEDVIDALGFKDLEIIETYTELNHALLIGGRSPGAVLHKISRDKLLRKIDFDFDLIARLVSREKARKIRRLVRRYAEFRCDCISLLEAAKAGKSLSRAAYRRLSDEVLDLVTFVEAVKEDAWDRYAATDELTGLLNRTAIDDIVERELRRAERSRNGLCIALIDVDHFKPVNDTHGHDAGDRVLVDLADRITDNLRAFDHIFRYGGEEILIVMPRTRLATGRKVLERLRRQIADAPLAISDSDGVNVTVSIGLSRWKPGTDIDTILKAADDALYDAKKGGRNRVCEAS